MNGILSDGRYAIRLFARTQLASAIAVGALALAIGCLGAVLSLYVAISFRSHPGYEDSDELITLGQSDGETLAPLTLGLVGLMAEEMTTITAVAGSESAQLLLAESGDPVTAELVSRGFFSGLRPRLYAGRGFEDNDHRLDAERVAIVSYQYWQGALNGGDVLGTSIDVELQPGVWFSEGTEELDSKSPTFRIVGILAPEVTGLVDGSAIWLPLERAAEYTIRGPAATVAEEIPRIFRLSTVARRARGVSIEAVIAEMRARYADLAGYFRISPGMRAEAVNGFVTDIGVLRESKRQLLILLAASGLLALVAAANVSLFLLARAPARRRELAIRMAVGAPLGRLGRQLVTESATLVIVAAGLGFLISIWLSSAFRGLAFLRQAQWNDVSVLDWRVLCAITAFALSLSVLTSLAPVFGLRRFSIGATSIEARARATPAQRITGTLQIAIAGALGAAAIGFAWHMLALLFGDPGFELENRYAVTMEYDRSATTAQAISQTSANGRAELARQRDRLEALPGVTAVTFSYPIPGSEASFRTSIRLPDNPEETVTYHYGAIDSRYIDVLGLRLRYGRGPVDGDTDVSLVNQAFARAVWGRDDVVGELTVSEFFGESQIRIIGVLEDVAFGHPLAEVTPIRFLVLDQPGSSTATIISALSAADLEQAIRRTVADGDVEIRVGRVRPLAQVRGELMAPDRARSLLTIGTAGLVVLLAAFGFYGTQRYLVTAGRREYAIRAALGAGPAALGRLVLGRAALFALPGLVAALLLSFIVVGWLRGDYVSREVDPAAVTAAVALGIAVLLLAASLGPARSAMRTQPAPLLRED